MSDHLVVATTHPLMMRHREVISQTIEFLRHGRFRRGPRDDCVAAPPDLQR
jgi:hypothetical protein